jgi:hypothetical protein
MAHLAAEFLVSEVHASHDPIDLLRDFFNKAEASAADRGVSLSLGDFTELREINACNQDTWFPMLPILDDQIGGASIENGFCIFGRDHNGDVVATQAARVFTMQDSDFQQEAETLRLFYAEPEATRSPDERCEVTTSACARVAGTVGFCGGVWYRPDYRGKELSAILPRIARAGAYCRWHTNFTTALMGEGVIKGGFSRSNGFANIERSVKWVNSPRGDRSFVFGWMTTAELLDDLAWFLSDFDTLGDRRVQKRRA